MFITKRSGFERKRSLSSLRWQHACYFLGGSKPSTRIFVRSPDTLSPGNLGIRKYDKLLIKTFGYRQQVEQL